MSQYMLIRADALRIPLADGCVQCVVTSPPYWGLRDYDVPGQLGLEPTPEEYVAKMVQVFREVRRVLRDDGCCWMNLGDSYNSQPGQRSVDDKAGSKQATNRGSNDVGSRSCPGLKPKDLVGIPWRVAFALQADGWYLRSEVIWSKPNPMPESVTDRPTKAHEQIFLLTKSARYFYDAEAVKEGVSPNSVFGLPRRQEPFPCAIPDGVNDKRTLAHLGNGSVGDPSGRNRRSVWHIPTQAYSGAHFATYPEALVEPCILAGTSEKGCCPKCGKCWERVTSKERVPTRSGNTSKVYVDPDGSPYKQHSGEIVGNRDPFRHCTVANTVGWRPVCKCNAGDPVPCIVLDPFNGSGTTGAVAVRHGRRYVGLDLSADYIEMATRRIGKAARPSTHRADVVGDAPLFAALQ